MSSIPEGFNAIAIASVGKYYLFWFYAQLFTNHSLTKILIPCVPL